MQITVKLDKRELEKALKRIPKDMRPRALVPAINRVASMAKTQVKGDIAREGKLLQRLVAPGLPVTKATRSKLEATIIPTGKRISMTKLNPRQTRAGVTAGKHRRVGAFIPKIKRKPVFKRDGKARLPIIKQTVSGVRAVASRANITKTIQAFAEAKLAERVKHEVGRLIARRMGR